MSTASDYVPPYTCLQAIPETRQPSQLPASTGVSRLPGTGGQACARWTSKLCGAGVQEPGLEAQVVEGLVMQALEVESRPDLGQAFPA